MNEIALRLAKRLFDQKVIQNQYRSAFIEAMIEPYLATNHWRYCGDGWSGWDFERIDKKRLEVKQSAAWQTWSGARNVKSSGAFDIAPRTGYFFENGTRYVAQNGRPADVFIFAWHPYPLEETKEEIELVDHRNPYQWEFYVVPTIKLPENQGKISLKKIQKLASKVPLSKLCEEVDSVFPLSRHGRT